jgi:hypothetical protein
MHQLLNCQGAGKKLGSVRRKYMNYEGASRPSIPIVPLVNTPRVFQLLPCSSHGRQFSRVTCHPILQRHNHSIPFQRRLQSAFIFMDGKKK